MVNYSDDYWKDVREVLACVPHVEKLYNKSILITGATGMICSSVAELLFELNRNEGANIKIYLAGRSLQRMQQRFYCFTEGVDYFYVEYDATTGNTLNIHSDFIIHGASPADPASLAKQPVETIYSNIIGLKPLLELCKKEKGTRLLYVSSSEVYGKKDSPDPYKELDYGYVDVLIPRGGAGLIKSVVENASVPVIETGSGNCHIYVDSDADIDMAISIIENAKTQRIGVCNACESLVIHKDIAAKLLPALNTKLKEHGVKIFADEKSREFLEGSEAATEEDFGKEYLDYIISVKTVESVEEAIAHINKYNTGHSESIITNIEENANKFLDEIDASCVYVNASTRFTDGFEFGFGAEIGISTQKLHARGPMGLLALTSYKYTIHGNGQVRK